MQRHVGSNRMRQGWRPGLGPGLAAVVVGGVLAMTPGLSRHQALAEPADQSPRRDARGLQSPNPDLLGVAQEPTLRVRVGRRLAKVDIGGPAHVLVELVERTGSAQLLRSPVSVTRTDRAWRMLDGQGQQHAIAYVGEGERRSGLSIRGVGEAPITLNGKALPGEIVLLPVIRGKTATGEVSPDRFHAVERVGIGMYLPGVVAKELIPGWELEAFKAQAIAARSYALHEMLRSRRARRRWDLEASNVDQVYAGATDNARAHQAVRETRGVVLTWEGRLLRAYYSSTSGGRPSLARDVWPTGPGFEFNLAQPLQGYGADEYGRDSPLYRWTVTRPAATLAQRLAAFGRARHFDVRQIKTVTGIEPVAANAFGRPTKYRIYGEGGTWWELPAEELRTASNWRGSSGLPGVSRKERVNSGDFTVSVTDGQVTFEGRGFGHGVGMCQYGAQKQAQQGHSAAEILSHYYPGAVLERAYY